jgi:hypothetical protein
LLKSGLKEHFIKYILSIYKKIKTSAKVMHNQQQIHTDQSLLESGGDNTWSIKINGTIFESWPHYFGA